MALSQTEASVDDSQSDLLSRECLEMLGLVRQPFAEHAPLPFIYEDNLADMPVNMVLNSLRRSYQPLLLKAEAGIGKTTLLRKILQRGQGYFQFCTLRGKQTTSLESIDSKFKRHWPLKQSASGGWSMDIRDYLRQVLEIYPRAVLIIDDAHLLSVPLLRTTLELRHEVARSAAGKFGLVLAAEPAIDTALCEIEADNAELAKTFEITVRPLTRDQSAAYLAHRLKVAGLVGDNPFDTQAVDELFDDSGGRPEQINQLAQQRLARLCERGGVFTSRQRSDRPVRLLIYASLGIAALGIAVTLAGFLINLFKPWEEGLLQQNLELPPMERTELEPPIAGPPPGLGEGEARVSLGELRLEPGTRPEAAATQTEVPEHLSEQTEPREFADRPAQSAARRPVVASGSDDRALAPQAPSAMAPDVTASLPAPEPQYPIKSHDWLLQQDPNAFAVQILAGTNLSALLDYAQQLPEASDPAFFKMRKDDEQWFVLLAGVFATREAADSAIQSLPKGVRRNTPWVRPMDTIQQLIRTAEPTG